MASFARSVTLALLLSLGASAAPARQVYLGSDEHGKPFSPTEHMSGIAPYHDAPGASILPPPGCRVSAAAFLIRHSCIYANSDEWDDYMAPFAEKIASAQDEGKFDHLEDDSPIAFLKSWKNPIAEDDVSQLTEPGRDDAFAMGKKFRELYAPLFPPKTTKHKGKKPKTPFKVYTASSERDVETSKAWIKGVFPKWQEGKDGEGDGKYVSLVKVPNKDSDWAGSLTPHKICPAFTKEAGKAEARIWLETFGHAPLARLNKMAPEVGFDLDDVIAAFMFCGYESVSLAERKSHFCGPKLFREHEFHAFGYWNDLKYYHQVGYGAKTSPYLGVGWLNSSTHNLLAAYDPPHPHFADISSAGSTDDLPPPDAPPDTEHTQLFFPYFTHREEPPVALVALGLWNGSVPDPYSMDHKRLWKTSHVLPFLGHVALERLACKGEDDHIRVVVNGASQKLPSCHGGPGGSCPIGDFDQFVKDRVEKYKDFEGACKKEE